MSEGARNRGPGIQARIRGRRSMMGVMRWDPFRDLLSVQDEMNQVFRRALGQGGRDEGRVWAPALDISERKEAYLVTVEVPGIGPEDLEVTLEDGVLTIQGERQFTQESSEQHFHRVERRYGSFRRTVTLPTRTKADEIEASFENGVLEVVVPKADEARSHKIEIRGAAGGTKPVVEGSSTN
jgi:HSP20 family protein